jgi:CelD/BcsL family acetyltransferase involved in cellulose biosynthesis
MPVYPGELTKELRDRLALVSVGGSLFSHPDWFAHLARASPPMDGHIDYIVSGDPARVDSPIACLPIVSHRKGMTRTITALSNFYSPIFSPMLMAGAEHALSEELARFVSERGASPDLIDLHPLDPASRFFEATQLALKKRGYWTDSYYCFGNWHLEVQGRSYAQYFSGLTSKIRKNAPRSARRLTELGATFKLITDATDLEWAINAYLGVYLKSWKHPEPYPDFIPGLCRLAAEKSWLRLGILSLGNVPLAAQIWLVKDGLASIYKLAYAEDFAKYSAGTMLTCEMMRHVIDVDKVRTVDYGMGDDPYKQEWMSHRRERVGIVAFNKRRPLGILTASRHFLGKFARRCLTRWRSAHGNTR